ncbi:MAG: hypothetical protein SH850_00540 [Planctomycetaceae bacterium]|nr:hypothetical protein [Planctomycetaceae bacterium]
MTSPSRRFRRLVPAIALVALGIWLGARWWGADQYAERAALDFVRLHGSTSEASAWNPLAQFLPPIVQRWVPRFSRRRITVCFPPEQLTDNMLENLLAIDDLHAIMVFDRRLPQGTRLVPSDIGRVAPQTSARTIARFRERFPHVKLWAVPQPKP